jgi:hypothetical protein
VSSEYVLCDVRDGCLVAAFGVSVSVWHVEREAAVALLFCFWLGASAHPLGNAENIKCYFIGQQCGK